jgi:Transposase DDE domain
MPAVVPLWQAVRQQVQTVTRATKLRASSVERLALLITGMIAAESAVVARVADELLALGLTGASSADSIARRLRRTLNDRRLEAATCYQPVLTQVLDWPALLAGRRTVTLVADESSQDDRIHLFRVSVAYWGGAVALAWAVWEQQQPLPAGRYWTAVEAVLDQVAALLPAGLAVVVTADRAFDIPPFVDRITARGWHWLVRAKARSQLRFRDHRGREQPLAAVLAARVGRAGQRWKGRGWVFKDAGWRAASVVAVWAAGTAEAMVVLTDLPPRWELLARYGRRWWTEPGFRNDKTAGWQWEASQVRGVAHQERLLVAMAWASVVVLCLGVQAAADDLHRLAQRHPRRVRGGLRVGRPQHARHSLFTLGLRRARQWLYRPRTVAFRWALPELDAPSWNARWYHAQAWRFLFQPQPVRP